VAFPTDARAEWSVDHESTAPGLEQAPVADADELERLLDRLVAEAAATQPFIVELVSSTGARLGVGLGAPAGSVLSFKESDDPPYYVSAGRPESASESDVGFYYQGHWSEFPEEALLPMELARAAAKQFLATGERPKAVDWEEV